MSQRDGRGEVTGADGSASSREETAEFRGFRQHGLRLEGLKNHCESVARYEA